MASDEERKAQAKDRHAAAKLKLADRNTKKAKMQNMMKETKTAEEEEKMRMDIDAIEKEIVQDVRAVEKAATEMEGVDARPIRDANLITSLLAGTSLEDPPDRLDLSQGIGLRETETVIAYKSNGMFGKVGIVCDNEIVAWPIYRIKKTVVIGDNISNLIDDRRAGLKNPTTKVKWALTDHLAVRGIALAVPLGYDGMVEDLAVPIPKLSAVQKQNLRDEKKPVPKQPDVQLLIEWKSPNADGKVLSWESRSGCRMLWKKNGDLAILAAAKHFEGHYRQAGGRHSSEERSVSPFDMPPVGDSLSPEGTPEPEQAASTATTAQNTPEPEVKKEPGTKVGLEDKTESDKASAEKNKTAWADFKTAYCEDFSIVVKDMTPEEYGNMKAAFTAFVKREEIL